MYWHLPPHLKNLTLLRLDRNQIGEKGKAALSERFGAIVGL
jgi:hypothetical protein